jgi:type IV secretion system protein VirD4
MARFSNPFQITDAPDHMMVDRRLRHRHIWHTFLLVCASGLISFYATPLVIWMYKRGMNLGPNSLSAIWAYFGQLWGPDPWAPHRVMLHQPGFVPGFLSAIVPGVDDPQLRVILAYMIVVGGTMIVAMTRHLTNSHKRMVLKQDASWCDGKTLRRMEERGQVGIRGGYLMSLGKWTTGLRAGMDVRMIETLSALCLAPPGTGKTAGIAVPTIVTCDTVSMVVNDRKPELASMTGAYRASIGHVIVLDWSKVDTHEVMVEEGTNKPILENGKPVIKHTFHPRFNPLAPAMVPPPGPDRDTYVQTVANALVPRKEDAKSGDGSYFADKGREALTGMIHALLARMDRPADDPIRYRGMREKWHGREASMPMLVDWIADGQFRATGAPDSEDGAVDEPGTNTGDKDSIGTWIRGLCEEINPESRVGSDPTGTTARGFGALSQLIAMADRERSGVLGTMDQALLPFKNASVEERTASSDFTPDDLRGIKDENGVWKPVTLYVCVNQAEADAFATITALLFEVLSRSLLTYKPNDYNPRTRRQLGPFAVCFCLDEFAKLPRVQAVLEGPDTGRSMGVSYLLIAQDRGQIEKIYSAADLKVIDTVTSVKIVLPQNETSSIQAIINMVGKITIRRAAHSFTEGLNEHAKPFSWNRSDTMEETDFLRNEDLVAMPQGQHIVIVQEFNNRPMRLRTPLYFKDPKIIGRVRARGKGPVATKLLPDHVRKQREKTWNSALEAADRLQKSRMQAAKEASVTTTENILDLG